MNARGAMRKEGGSHSSNRGRWSPGRSTWAREAAKKEVDVKDWWAMAMLFSGGLFAGGVVSIGWERVPAWKRADLADFRAGFAYTLRRVDRLQPALLTVCLVSTIAFAVSTGSVARALAILAAGGFLVILVGSVAWLVPIQRRLVAVGSGEPSAYLDGLRARWLRGHLIRAAGALALFVLAVVAASR